MPTPFRFALCALLFCSAVLSAAEPGPQWVFFGTSTGGKGALVSEGIYRSRFDPATGEVSKPELAVKTAQPTFLAVHPTLKFLYAVGEMTSPEGKKSGAVTAFSLDAKTGQLVQLNQFTSGGSGPCHVSLDRTGRCAFVANYGSGSVSSIPIGADGMLQLGGTVVQHAGKSVHPTRQTQPHAHSMNVDPTNRYVIAADLGLDQLKVYDLDVAAGKITPHSPPYATLAPGAGPRHYAFHPTEPLAFCLNEIDSTLTLMKFDAAAGTLTPVQTLSTLPASAKVSNTTAEVVVHPNGKFVYASNRGHNSIAAFELGAGPSLKALGQTTGDIHTPRNFNIAPGGKFLFVANQGSDSIVVFTLDPESGKLTPTATKLAVAKPMCVKFVPIVP